MEITECEVVVLDLDSQPLYARELGIHRKTVWRYTQKLAAKCTISTSGSEAASEPKCTISTPGIAGRRSDCDPFTGVILSKLGLGLSAQRIFQDLRVETGFEGSYQSVKRFVRRLQATHPERVWRMECEPGEEMQVDFGLGAMIEQESGRARRSWVFRVVLSYSRKGYSEAVFRQDTETFLRCLENAIRHFGGVPLVLNIDNLKAAVGKREGMQSKGRDDEGELLFGEELERPNNRQSKNSVEQSLQRFLLPYKSRSIL